MIELELIEDLFSSDLATEAFKIFLAGLLGAVVGMEREGHGQAAGLRTFILVSIGACLMMIISLRIAGVYVALGSESAVRVDPGRIASYALAGMGFLGAGAIITGKGSVRGLTTAAGMWLTTGVGLAVGAGIYYPAIIVTLLAYLVLYTLRHRKVFVQRDRYIHLFVVTEGLEDRLMELECHIQDAVKVKIQWKSYKILTQEERFQYSFQLLGKEDEDYYLLVKRLMKLKGIISVELKEGKVN
mgnify:CR=1 FL=1